MPSELIDFWRRYDASQFPYVHPDDWPVLESNGRRYINGHVQSFADFLSSTSFGDFDDARFHLSLMPAPFVGDLGSADIVIVLLNPGLSFSDYYAEWNMTACKQRLQATLKQNLSAFDFPFMWLDPAFCWHPGLNWWERKLREVLTRIAKANYGGSYLKALESLSQRLACVELVPYHSASFKAHGLIDKLSSAKAAKAFAHRVVVDAAKGNRTIIVTRQASQWEITARAPNVVVYPPSLTRGANMGVSTPGGKAILARYGIPC